MPTNYRYSHRITMILHGLTTCGNCDGDYWLQPVCHECNFGWVRTCEANTHFKRINHHAASLAA
jgi:hypothetical protein